MTIRLLPEHIINQIAAGEVIENPASVVKELVENALDAKATRITVEIKEGGQQLIRVSDNGTGMNADDALACLQRHATSKIEKAEDLFRLYTMGFRGEALSSIASISHLSLTTSQGNLGTRVLVDGGKVMRVEPCARSQGTTIDVLSLFYNVPARKKFQKKATVNAAEITRVLMTMSLAHPEVAFELIQQERSSFSTSTFETLSFEEGLAERARSVLGEEFTSFKISHSGLVGFVGAPQFSRQNRGGQHLFINRRPVISQAISFAVKDAFGTTIEDKRHPVFVLHLTLPPEEIDVNVHPQKKEVRLYDERKVREQVLEAVRLSLYQEVPAVLSTPLYESPLPRFSSSAFETHTARQLEELSHYPSTHAFREEGAAPSVSLAPVFKEESDAKSVHAASPHVIGIFASYLLLEASSVAARVAFKPNKEESMLLVDLIAAKQKVVFEALVKKGVSKSTEQQLLLFPLTLEFSLHDMEKLLPHLSAIEELGFSLRAAGARTIFVDALPSFVKESDVFDLLLKIAGELSDHAESEYLLAKIVSRFAKAEKKHFMVQEALELFEALLKTASPLQNLSGNPTMVYVSSHDLEHFFNKKNSS